MTAPKLIENISFVEEYAKHVNTFAQESDAYTNYTDSDPAMQVLSVASGISVEIQALINTALLQYFVDYATGQWLDLIGSNKGLTRLVVQEANPNTVPPTEAILETDDDFRIRLKNPPPNNACTEDEYEFFATQFDANIKSAIAKKREWNTDILDISIITKDNNGIPSETLIDNLNTYLNRTDIRGMNDTVIVAGATPVPVDVTATITLLEGASSSVFDDLQGVLEEAFSSIAIAGRDVTISWLLSVLQVEGVYKVELTLPTTDTSIDASSFPVLGNVNLTLAVEEGF
ncbi:baseplate J/gp47 family protein [Cognatishimia sp.]|uniref:baseplate J/gp47 family protein n=1 Tax=Cognatishimia sp. TaxID=2211648 RepID=UPI003517BE4E|nr:baseplate J/gp47 family protein [Cognatishimia sp.]